MTNSTDFPSAVATSTNQQLVDRLYDAVQKSFDRKIEAMLERLLTPMSALQAALDGNAQLKHQVDRHAEHLARLQTTITRQQTEIAALKSVR